MNTRSYQWTAQLLFAAGLLACTTCLAGAADEKAGVSESTGVQIKPANTIDFVAAYALPFNSLTSLGARIEQSRAVADPIGLATAANELAVAESVSGKQASLTAAELRKEAVALGMLRKDVQELTALAMLAEDSAPQLKKAAQAAQEAREDLAAAQKSGEEPKGNPYYMQVHNHCSYPVQVYCNGYAGGCVQPYSSYSYPCYGQQDVYYGRGPCHTFQYQQQSYNGNQHWHLR